MAGLQRSRSASFSFVALQASTYLFSLLVVYMLVTGWSERGEYHLTPESGLGYALGIIGSVLMLLLMGYPLRKRVRFMRGWGALRNWFRIHMVLGVVGPVAILFHCNFNLGSINSNVALFSMLAVALSGLAGRYIYSQIHYGLYGNHIKLRELTRSLESSSSLLNRIIADFPRVRRYIDHAVDEIDTAVPSLAGAAFHVLKTAYKSRMAHLLSLHYLKREIARAGWSKPRKISYRKSARHRIRKYLKTCRMVAGLTFFERLFSMWHLLHLPLFIFLVITAIAHIVAVHMY